MSWSIVLLSLSFRIIVNSDVCVLLRIMDSSGRPTPRFDLNLAAEDKGVIALNDIGGGGIWR